MNSFAFFNTIGSYRKQQLYVFLIESEFADRLLNVGGKVDAEKICLSFGWDISFGSRLLDVLLCEGLILEKNGDFGLSEQLTRYFSKRSKFYQGYNIRFENYLQKSWETLPEVLKQGKRVFSTELKNDQQYSADLDLYIRAMDNVATIRAGELLDKLEMTSSGCFVDLAGGSGTYTFELLNRYKNWKGIYIDTKDVSEISQSLLEEKITQGHYPESMKERILYKCIDFIQDPLPENIAADCILLSNIIHCYGNDTIEHLINKCRCLLNDDGIIIVHDFFKGEETGSLYDIHMMLNTYDGKTYHKQEFTQLMDKNDFVLCNNEDLSSSSSFLIFKKNR